MAGGGFNPDWIPAALAALAAFGGVSRWVYRNHTRRAARVNILNELSEKVWGRPERKDERGVVYAPAEPGLESRVAAVEDAYAGHRSHPPGRGSLTR